MGSARCTLCYYPKRDSIYSTRCCYFLETTGLGERWRMNSNLLDHSRKFSKIPQASRKFYEVLERPRSFYTVPENGKAFDHVTPKSLRDEIRLLLMFSNVFWKEKVLSHVIAERDFFRLLRKLLESTEVK